MRASLVLGSHTSWVAKQQRQSLADEDSISSGVVASTQQLSHGCGHLGDPLLAAYRAHVAEVFLFQEQAWRYQLENFVTVTEAHMDVYDFWNGGFVEWEHVPWKRSALEFIKALHPDVTMISQLHTGGIDEAVRAAAEEAGDLELKPPAWMPESHWWWCPPQRVHLH